MRNHHNQSDNAPHYVISRVSFQAWVFCINRLSYYEGGGMTHTCRKVTQILYFALIKCTFSLSFKTHGHSTGRRRCISVVKIGLQQVSQLRATLSFFLFCCLKRAHSFNKSFKSINIFFNCNHSQRCFAHVPSQRILLWWLVKLESLSQRN